MFKKIEVWIVLLIILAMLVFAFLFGFLVRQEIKGYTKFGKLSETALFISEIPLKVKRAFFLIDGSKKDLKAKNFTIQRDKNLKSGFNLYTDIRENSILIIPRYDGEIQQSVIDVYDMTSYKKIFTYKFDTDEVINLIDTTKDEFVNIKNNDRLDRFRHNHPFIDEKGDVLTHSYYSVLFKMSMCGNLEWADLKNIYHHSIELDNDGNFLLPSVQYNNNNLMNIMTDEFTSDYNDDSITIIDTNGNLIFQKSVTELLIENDYLDINFSKDPIHLNDIQPVLKDGPYWNKGDLFLSLRNLSMVILYRPFENKILKIIKGPFTKQHDVDIISEKEITIFNNNIFFNNSSYTYNYGNVEILKYDFENESFTKLINQSLILEDIKTSEEGLHHITKDQNIIIEEQEAGKLIMFDKNGKKLWEYINKDKNGDTYLISWSRLIKDKNLVEKLRKLYEVKKC